MHAMKRVPGKFRAITRRQCKISASNTQRICQQPAEISRKFCFLPQRMYSAQSQVEWKEGASTVSIETRRRNFEDNTPMYGIDEPDIKEIDAEIAQCQSSREVVSIIQRVLAQNLAQLAAKEESQIDDKSTPNHASNNENNNHQIEFPSKICAHGIRKIALLGNIELSWKVFDMCKNYDSLQLDNDIYSTMIWILRHQFKIGYFYTFDISSQSMKPITVNPNDTNNLTTNINMNVIKKHKKSQNMSNKLADITEKNNNNNYATQNEKSLLRHTASKVLLNRIFDLYNEMVHERGIKPNNSIISLVISSCTSMNQFMRCQRFWESIQHGWIDTTNLTIDVWNAIIFCHVKAKNCMEAMKLYEDLIHLNKSRNDAVSGVAVANIDTTVGKESTQNSDSNFHGTTRKKDINTNANGDERSMFEPNAVTYATLIHGCKHHARKERYPDVITAEFLFNQGVNINNIQDARIYEALLDIYASVGDIASTVKLYKEMKNIDDEKNANINININSNDSNDNDDNKKNSKNEIGDESKNTNTGDDDIFDAKNGKNEQKYVRTIVTYSLLLKSVTKWRKYGQFRRHIKKLQSLAQHNKKHDRERSKQLIRSYKKLMNKQGVFGAVTFKDGWQLIEWIIKEMNEFGEISGKDGNDNIVIYGLLFHCCGDVFINENCRFGYALNIYQNILKPRLNKSRHNPQNWAQVSGLNINNMNDNLIDNENANENGSSSDSDSDSDSVSGNEDENNDVNGKEEMRLNNIKPGSLMYHNLLKCGLFHYRLSNKQKMERDKSIGIENGKKNFGELIPKTEILFIEWLVKEMKFFNVSVSDNIKYTLTQYGYQWNDIEMAVDTMLDHSIEIQERKKHKNKKIQGEKDYLTDVTDFEMGFNQSRAD